jgi:hypothetical protein
MKKAVGFLLLFYCFVAFQQCKGHGDKNVTYTSDTIKFFPVNLYVQGQIARVDSFATTIYKININPGHTQDTAIITKQQFKQLAQPFLEYDISDKSLHKYYKENDFADETTQSLTFNYTSLDSTLPLQSIDILLSHDASQLKNVFYSIQKTGGDSTVIQKTGWKNDKSFFINRSVQLGNNAPVMQQTIVFWQFTP